MASGGYFVHDRYGYGYVLNASPEIGHYCQLQGEMVADSAWGHSGAEYTVDTQHGWTRWHTRVTAPSARNADGSWNRDYFRERAFNALPMAHVLYGGKLGSFKLKPRPYRAGRKGRR